MAPLALDGNLKWHGTENSSVCAIYAKPDVNWHREASEIAVKWQDGLLAVAEANEHMNVVSESPAPLIAATA